MKTNIIGFIILGTLNIYGFEVNTHQALTRCAITNECNQGGSENLEAFISHSAISTNNIYRNQLFDKYTYKATKKPITYIDYILGEEDAIKDYQVKVNGDYKGMIEAGVILEDALYSNGVNSADGRFNNHFYAAQIENTKADCRMMTIPLAGLMSAVPTVGLAGASVVIGNTELMRTNKALCMGMGPRTDNIDWVMNKNVDLALVKDYHRTNDYGLDDAFSYFKKSFEGNEIERKKYQSKLFVSLGFMVHLLQDLHSPAHCRDGSHPKGDYLEIYGRYDGGFYLRDGTFSKAKNNSDIMTAIKNTNIEKIMLRDNSYVSYEDFYKKEADWVSNNFFSESHISLESPNKETGEGLEVNNLLDNDTIFDSFNTHPEKDVDTDDSYKADDGETDYFNRYYITTYGNTIKDRVKGAIHSNARMIALVDKSIFGSIFDSEHMIAPKYKKVGNEYNVVGTDSRPLADTAINVMPRAVASTQAFINFFFRGQMETSLSDDHTKLVIKNVSVKEGRVHDEKLLTFKSGGKFYVYYEQNGENKSLKKDGYRLTQDIVKDRKVSIHIGDALEDKNLADGTKITVVYDGNIGDNLGGYDDYGIGMKGLSADVFKFKQIKCENPKMSQLIKSLKELIANPKNCVSFSDIHDSVEPKSIYFSERDCTHYGSRVRYKNTELTTGIYGDNINKYEESSLVIDYFNHYIYHFDEPTEDVYTAGTSYSPRSLPRGGDFDVSFSVSQTKNGEPNGIYNLPKLLTYTYLPSNEHVRSPHYHVTCNSSQSLCGYLKGQQLGQNFIEHNVNNIAPYIFLSTTGSNKVLTVGNTIRALNKYYGEYYGQYIKDDKYPDDWLKKMVDWIENYDCKKISKTNIFYDEKRIEKSDQLKGL